MRPVILICLFVIFGYISNAQFTILPQIGFENSRTSIEFNELSSFSPAGTKISPQAGIRLDYKFKQIHGLFLGMATSRSIVKFNFSEPGTGMNAYTASRGNTELRVEGGYQFSTRPIYFKKPGSANKLTGVQCHQSMERKSCGNSMARNCCRNRIHPATAAKSTDKGSWVRIQPSLGVAYIPFTPSAEVYTKSLANQTSYVYNAGNWKTAFIGGLGFEFGKNAQRNFVISINYLKGMGNFNAGSINTVSGNKLTNTSLKSDASSWNIRMGIPISLSKRKPVVKEQIFDKTYRGEKMCGQYKLRCHRVI